MVPAGPPTANELDVLMQQAKMLAPSGIIPREYQGNPPNILAAALMGRAFGWDALTAMRMVTVIQGTASLKPEAMLALIRQRGHHVNIEPHSDGKGVTVKGKRADNGDQAVASFTLADAERAGLTKSQAWRNYPVDMCQWRAVARLSRSLFGDVVLGAGYIPEELGGDAGVPDSPVLDNPFVPPAPVDDDVMDVVDAEVIEVLPPDTAPPLSSMWGVLISEAQTLDELRDLWREVDAAGHLADWQHALRMRADELASQ
jgi:hypothetical protein